jgi:glycine cleavage system aminomethyltransferase T
MWGGELLLRDGLTSGRVTSAAWGATVGACVGLGWLWSADGGRVDPAWVRSGRYEVDIAGARRPVSVSSGPLVDPEGERIRP